MGGSAGVYWINYRGTHFPVSEKECLVGRGKQCAIVLPSSRVACEHAVIRRSEQGLELVDVSGRNDILVNGFPAKTRKCLSYGDLIQIGDEVLLVTRKVESERPPPPGVAALPAVAQRQALELAEELLLRGAEAGRRHATARAIYSIVNTIIQNANPATCQLSFGETVRLTAVAQVAARWIPDHSLDEWSQEVERTMSRAPACLARAP